MGSTHKTKQPGSALVGTPNTPLFVDCCGGKYAYECTFRIAFMFSVNRFGCEDAESGVYRLSIQRGPADERVRARAGQMRF